MITTNIVIDEETLKGWVISHLGGVLNLPLEEKDVIIEVKSKQNYRATWEPAKFRATVVQSFKG